MGPSQLASYLPSFKVSPFTVTVVLGLRDFPPPPQHTGAHKQANRLLVGKNFGDSKSTLWWDGGCEAAHVWPGCQADDWLSVLSETRWLSERTLRRPLLWSP